MGSLGNVFNLEEGSSLGLSLGLGHEPALGLLDLHADADDRLSNLFNFLGLFHLLELVDVLEVVGLVDVADFGVHFYEDSEETEDVEQDEILDLAVEGGVHAPGVEEVDREVVGSDFEEEGGVGQQDELVEDDPPLGPLHHEHHDPEVAHEEDHLEGEGDHGNDLVPVPGVDDQEEPDEAEGAGHLREEDVVEEDVEVEDFPGVLAQAVGRGDGDHDGGQEDPDREVALG